MSRPKLGTYIRKLDYLSMKEDSEYEDETPSNKLIDYENLCNNDDQFNFEEVKDGMAAFREKVCISKFPGRHSPPYWLAYSTVCALDRFLSEYEDDEDKVKEIGREYVYTWLALLCARPSSGHLDIMSKLEGDMFEQYIQQSNAEELAKIMSQMKIKFNYDAKNETDEEHTYASFLRDRIRYFFESLTESQCEQQVVMKAFFDLRMFYQQQISKLSSEMACYVGYLVRDMSDKFPEENFKDMGGSVQANLKVIEESLCTFDGDVKSLRDEESLGDIIKAARTNDTLKDIFPELMSLITKFSKRKTPLKNGDRIYDVYRLKLYRDMKQSMIDKSIFEGSLAMIESVLTDGNELVKSKQDMIDEAFSDCILKVNMTAEQGKTVLDVLLLMIKSGRKDLVKSVNSALGTKEYTKKLAWKNLIPEAQQFLHVIGVMKGDQLEDEDGDFDDVLSKLKDVVETLMELFNKGKILKELSKDIVVFVFKCLESQEPEKTDLAYRASDDKYLTLTVKDKEVVDDILDKVYDILKTADTDLDIDRSTVVQNFVFAVIKSYNENGKNVTDSQHEKFMSIYTTCCEGESLADKMLDSEDESVWTVFRRVFMSAIMYLSLHVSSKTVSRCLSLIKNTMKLARMSAEEEHSDLMLASFGALYLISTALEPEIAEITPEVVELFLMTDKTSEMIHLLRGLYAFNPQPILDNLQKFIEKMENMSYADRVIVVTLLMEVSGKQPKEFTEDQVGKLLDFAMEDNQTQPTYFHVLNQITTQNPPSVCQQFSKLVNGSGYNSSVLIFRVMIVVRLGCYDQSLFNKAAEFALKQIKISDTTKTQQILSQLFLLVRTNREEMLQYRSHIELLQKKAGDSPDLKEYFENLINAIDGKSVAGVFEDLLEMKEDIDDLDKKVGATMNTVVSLGDHVIEQGKDISKVRNDVGNLGERVDNVEEDLTDTKVKVEEIDNKTMTNAPKWSRDLTKLLNPKAENDWRLLAKRLQYSNDDIRAWAQQHDPCMALLSEWYATHKTSEANFAILNNLQEMNRLDGAIIVENAMKATEDVVEDDEFEYPSPPPIFLSYQWGVQNEVKLLKQHLNMAGYECWMDIGQMGGGDKLFNKIDNGIRGAKVIICCTTEKYAQSPNCNREVNLSVNLGKPIIPLLMEKMSWPPKGSMGPIFSEYLFIRFFQRNGEETKDQRYWPVAKFQELLMQLNFYTVPDPSLIKQEYSNWWNPIVEEIKIDKNKNAAKGTEVSKTNTNGQDVDESPLVFLSYQWGRQPQVKLLYERLVSSGYTVWMDIFQMGGGDSLYDKIDRGLRGCKVVVSCVTPKYALSANCRREISLADALKKPIIPLLLEAMTWPPDGPMSMVFTELLFINVHRDQQIQEKWTGPKVDELMGKLKIYIPDNEQIHSGGNDKNENNMPAKLEPEKPKTVSSRLPKSETKTATNQASNSPKNDQKQEKVETKSDKNQENSPKKAESQKQASKSCILL
ncbi:uncharacterized protein LOC132747531 [Ruditapes philippinarum]|uniref:uncharacterized protein LOC132747531 n=1 Tax=Ruditapes philippinarum TaxID=129788 RepID=UPI00295B3388|nr:uncharacterized protein LOC132747531 [Ruditapes philippinarum]